MTAVWVLTLYMLTAPGHWDSYVIETFTEEADCEDGKRVADWELRKDAPGTEGTWFLTCARQQKT